MPGRTPPKPVARQSFNPRATSHSFRLPTASLIKRRGYSSNFQVSNSIKVELNRSGEDNLNKFQLAAAITVDEHYVNFDELRKATWFDSIEHVKTFHYLVNKNVKPNQALEMMTRLTSVESYGLCHGLEKKDFLGLDRAKIRALLENKKFGLKASHLRDQTWFNSGLHVNALAFLLRDNPSEEVSVTVKALKDIAENKLELIRTSFGLHHMKGVTDKDIIALHELNLHFGVIAKDICYKKWFTGPYLFRALHALVFDKSFEVDEAILTLSNLDEDSLRKLEKRNIDDVLPIKKGVNLSA